MRFYRVSAAEVEDCLQSPTATTPTLEGRLNYWCGFPPLVLRVTLIEEHETFVIITVTMKDELPAED